MILSTAFSNIFSTNWEKEAHAFGKIQNIRAIASINEESVDGLGESNFDGEAARSKMDSAEEEHNEIRSFVTSKEHRDNTLKNKGFDLNEGFLHVDPKVDEKGNLIFWEEGMAFQEKKCIQSGEPFLIDITRNLHVAFEERPSVRKVRRCEGHKYSEKHHKKDSVNKRKKTWEKELSEDREIKEFSVVISNGKAFSKHKVKKAWSHIDDATSCDSFHSVEESFLEFIEQDSWVYSSQEESHLLSSIDGTLFRQECVDGNSYRVIEGKEVYRPCWRERLIFLYRQPERNDCSYLEAFKCTLVKKFCLEKKENSCALWEKTFKCRDKGHERKVSGLDFDSGELIENDLALPESEIRSSFADVSSKIAVFSDIQSELQESGKDARDASVFPGKKHQCSKNVLDGVMYDCCFSFRGAVKDIGLAKCSAEEIALAEMRERGQCYHVGKFSETFLGMWKSRDVHSFCCFPSKLSRVFQEEARKQLGLDFGKPQKPDCSGLHPDLLSQINFNQLDLGELYSDQMASTQSDIEQRLSNFEVRLGDIQEKMKQGKGAQK